MAETSTPRLMAAAKEFNIGKDVLVDFLVGKGFNRDDLKPSAKLTGDMYRALQTEFQNDKVAKLKSEQIDLPKGSVDGRKKKEDETIIFKKEVRQPVEQDNNGSGSVEENLYDRVIINAPEFEGPKVIDKIDLSNIDSSVRPQKLDGPKILGKIVLPSNTDTRPLKTRRTAAISDWPDHALSLVVRCLKDKSLYLDLGNVGLSSRDFEEGSELDVALRKCTHLMTLILSNEWWEWNGRENWWGIVYSKNRGLRNYLTELPPALAHLPNLTKLICCGEMNDSWGIKDIGIISSLSKLVHLDLRDNYIKDLSPLKQLISIKTLFVNRNMIEDISCLFSLKQLTHVDIHTNHIVDLTGIENLTSLKNLDIHNNKIKEIQGLDKLEALEEIYLQENEIEDISGFEFLLRKEAGLYIEIDENPLVKLYQLKLHKKENHFPFLKELLMRQSDSSKKLSYVYPVKVLMLGNHASGKSSLVNYLTNNKNAGSTHILRIENYFISDKHSRDMLPDAIFFDFGGQDFYHGLYQAFISRDALQVILFNPATDKNEIDADVNKIPTIYFNRQYWLGQKKYAERNGNDHDPYIVVQTYADIDAEEALPVDHKSFKGYKKGFTLCLSDNRESDGPDEQYYQMGREYLRAYFNTVLRTMQQTKEEPVWYVQFLKYVLAKEGKTYIATGIDDLLKHYKVKDLTDEDKLESLKTNLITLHRHGLVLYYPQVVGLDNIVWLDPQKLVEYIQDNILNKSFIDSTTHKVPGVIPKSTFEKLVKDERIILLLKEQRVIFLHNPTGGEEDEEYIIPNYLPLVDRTEANFQLFTFGLDKPDFILKFNDFIPFGFINQIICFFGKQPDVKRFWRNQVLFTLHNEARVLIELGFTELKVKVHFQRLKTSSSDDSHIREYLFYSLMALYWNFKSEDIPAFSGFLKYKDFVNGKGDVEGTTFEMLWSLQNEKDFVAADLYISLDDKHFVRYSDLFHLPEKEYRVQSFGMTDGRVDLANFAEIPVGPFKAFTIRPVSVTKNIFVAYSRHDEEYLQEFEDHLVTLRAEGVATFNCRKIEFGKEWDEEIKMQIRQCDLMVCLVSVKFLNTDYINKIEIPTAIEQEKPIVPIIIKACDWENSTLGKYQAVNRGKIVSLDNNQRLLGQIKGYTPEERAAFWTDIVKEFRAKVLLT